MNRYSLPKEEIERLRTLARRQAELAALPVMAQRRKKWLDMNDGVPGARPPFAIETWTFDRDFMPASLFQCTTDFGRSLEGQFLRNIRHHEILNDDHVCPGTLDIGWDVSKNEFGIEIKTEHVKDAEGVVTGYHFECPLKNLANGFDQIRPATFSVDKAATLAKKAFLEECFGDLLPVAIHGYGMNAGVTQRLMPLMTMETFFLEMYDHPETLHRLMTMIKDNIKRFMLWEEEEGLLTINNENQCTCGTCFNFTTRLPKRTIPPGGKVFIKDLWGVLDSQETVGLSPEMFNEFCLPHYQELAAMNGRNYWGCCEPADPIWESSLSKLQNLGGVSISRWANQDYMAEALDGKGIVFSRKPDPNLLSVFRDLDEDAWKKEIRKTIDIVTRHTLPFSFVVRDVYTMHGNVLKSRRATELAQAEIDRVFGSGAST